MMLRRLILLLLGVLLWATPASAIPDVVVLHILDDEHTSSQGDWRTDTATHPSSATWSTPAMDSLSNSGIRFNNMFSQSTCSPSRGEIIGYGRVGRLSNPLGRTQTGDIPAITTVGIAAGGMNLIRTFQDAGYTVAGFGKLHTGIEQVKNFGGDTWAKQIGFDVYEAMVQSNDPFPLACIDLIPPIDPVCWGHNFWCSYDLDGNFAIEGDGTSTAGPNNGYVNDVIHDAAAAYITNTALVSGKHLIIIGWHAPHAGWDDGSSMPGFECDYDGDGEITEFLYVDDRVPGSVLANEEPTFSVPIYGEQLEHADGRMGAINGLLNLAAGGANHLAVAIGDNGVPGQTASATCSTSRGTKGTPYPCGVSVPLAFQGDDIVRTGIGEINGLYRTTDLPKTLARLIGTAHPRRDGMSFADCLTNSNGKDVSTCPSREVVTTQEWAPLGGNLTAANPWGPRDGDSAAEWDRHELGSITDQFGGKKFFLQRIYDTDVTHGPYCELMFEITGADPYIAAVTTPIEETSCSTPFGGGLIGGGFDADEASAYALMSRDIDLHRDRSEPAPAIGGGSR